MTADSLATNVPALLNSEKDLSKQANWKALFSCSSETAREKVPLELALKLNALPLSVWQDGEIQVLSLLVDAPLGFEQKKEIKFVSNCEIVWDIAEADDIRQAIRASYAVSDKLLVEKTQRAETSCSNQKKDYGSSLELSAPVPLLLEALIERAEALGASDIHLEPIISQDLSSTQLQLRFRVDGRLQKDTGFKVGSHVAENLFRRLKIISGLDITCNQKAQEGGFSYTVNGRSLRLRVSVVPLHNGEKAVIRLLDSRIFKTADPSNSFRGLGLVEEQLSILRSALAANSGAILLAGPTGSGKSTLLYSAVEYLNSEWRNIVTMEDPVERFIQGVNQIPVTAEGSANLLVSLLRQDPDVIMIGEIRDLKTAETALTASVTGHLVLSTVHAGSTIEVFARLLQMGLKAELLSCSLRLLVSQRLVPLNCEKCKKQEVVSSGVRKLLKLANSTCYSSSGCKFCRYTGISGRLGVFEFLPIVSSIKSWLWTECRNGFSPNSLREILMEEGFVPIAIPIRQAVLESKVSVENALLTLGVANTRAVP